MGSHGQTYQSSVNLNADSLTLKESILGKIIRQRQLRLLEQSKQKTPNYANHDLQPSRRSLVDSLHSSACGLILECKHSSPSRGVLTDKYQPAHIAIHYQDFCSAISVLTEPDFFSGSLEDLIEVRQAVSSPILCKDFIVELSQIYAARAAGADIILLMLSVISDEFWKECNELARDLGLDIITEVNSQQEVERAIALPTKIIGINNRNLHTLKTDISMTEKLVKLIPEDRLVISESGISEHQHLKRLAPFVDGFLIGSSLMQSNSIPKALRKLLFGEVKVCGLTRREDAELAWDLGASFGGIIFTEKSSRCISKQQAALICDKQPLPMVGVFMDQSNELIIEYAKDLNLSIVQLHGSETLQQLQQLRRKLDEKCKVWKAICCSEVDNQYPTIAKAQVMKVDLISSGVDRVLIDLPKKSSGKNHGLNYQPLLSDGQIIIAGGLTLDSISQLQNSTTNQQAGFDICSGIEISPGIKDQQKMTGLFNALLPKTRSSRGTQ
ncbi:MAG: bifunctional indole-3-glycerol-phosphate synthase TrpC/phosphoribosylanthranilate isomerase TrpF [Gammaproteobacteria bacterium]|nr:MAG: bifunctional indole-3-glycerol-phosphate synthase TrpC/phosphoribosylanthranilate isomerase TrpF [Gammaproteobacteria bacterium]